MPIPSSTCSVQGTQPTPLSHIRYPPSLSPIHHPPSTIRQFSSFHEVLTSSCSARSCVGTSVSTDQPSTFAQDLDTVLPPPYPSTTTLNPPLTIPPGLGQIPSIHTDSSVPRWLQSPDGRPACGLTIHLPPPTTRPPRDRDLDLTLPAPAPPAWCSGPSCKPQWMGLARLMDLAECQTWA